MDTQNIIYQLEKNREVFKSMLRHISQDDAAWKPSENEWSLLEVLCHLFDEEREDFRARVKHTLESPELPIPGNNPVGWVTERDYQGQDYAIKLEDFLDERRISIEWLRNLKDPNWSQAYQHPKWGPLSASLFLSNWLAHDYIHIRQINRIKYQLFEKKTAENLDYAGNW